MRKLIIGLIAVGFVASLFWGYALIMDAKPIEVRDVAKSDNLDMPESSDTAQQAGQTDVRVARAARYVVLDPETKETSRIFGFEKLLNPGADTTRRQVEKPYMIFYESNVQCRIDADMGMFQVETSGSSSTPKDAQLNGNVKIHIIPKADSRMSETVVEMDDLVFSSERSEFATDRKVHIKSDQVELIGTGLVVILDPASGRIDYLHIRDLEDIQLRGLTGAKSGTKIADAKTDTAPANLTPTQPIDDASVPSEKAGEAEAKLVSPLKYYQCILEDNVEIMYGNEIVITAADAINIQNILFSKLDQSPETDGTSEQAKDKPKAATKSSQPSEHPVETAQNIDSNQDVLIKCDGGLILKPMQHAAAEQVSVAQLALSKKKGDAPLRIAKITPDLRQTPTIEAINLAGGVNIATEPNAAAARTTGSAVLESVSDENDSPPVKFEARTIDYDLLTGSGLAHGPVRFTFYQTSDPNSTTPTSPIPITVMADENARFIADSSQTIKQAVFNGNVMTTRRSQMPDFVQVDNLHSEKLTIDLDEVQTGSLDVSDIKMTEGKVYLQSQRIQQDRKLSDIKLYCTEISYAQADNVILAEGPGKIEWVNNEQPQTTNPDAKSPMDQPCVAMVDGFTAIRWDMDKQSIIADGDQETMKLAYYPILDGRIQKQIFVYSMRLEMSYLPDTAEVEKVFTEKPIIYEEWNSDMTKREHYIIGQSLDYDAVEGDGWMKIAGTPAVPCNVDGARMPEVFVHPVTGDIKASISTRPGILRGR
ncbi:MAG: hypothetical protein DRP52_02905 [Planctomycetota bacterium]|nr:MAG: hypothetical protein DRP52_02905 [Planctomycetota bacterium]